jgi:uncharacterized protein (TIGR03663 family)
MSRWFLPGLLLIVGAALALRLPQLERRPMHNDEGVNAIKFRELWIRNAYRYDPNEHHGPTLEYLTLPAAILSGKGDYTDFSESTYRIVAVAFGVGLLLLLPFLADGLGRAEALSAAALTALSPAMVFYSRYYIHEMLLVFFSALLLVAVWRYLQTRKAGWALVSGVAIGLMHATKETFVFSLAAGILAAAAVRAWDRWTNGNSSPARSFLNARHVALGIGAAIAISVVFFTSFFTNAQGPVDSIRTYLPWLSRAGGESPHVHPWYDYFRRLLFFHYPGGPYWSEGLILILAAIGGGAAFRRGGLRDSSPRLVRGVVFYTLFLAAIYTVLPYKTPWCLLGFWQPAMLLGGIGMVVLLRARAAWMRPVAGLLILGGGIHLGWQAWLSSFELCASPFNPYVYAQTSPDLVKLVQKIEALSRQSPAGRDMVVKVMSPNNDYWPLPWYFRGFSHVGWWSAIPADPYAPVMVVSSQFEAAFDERPEKTHLMAGYFQLRPQVFLELYVETGLWRAYVETLPRDEE